MNEPVKVGLLWRQEWDPPGVDGVDPTVCRLHGVFAAFAELGVAAVPVVYSDDTVEKVRLQLLDLDGVLVWVNPMQNGLDRSKLDPLPLATRRDRLHQGFGRSPSKESGSVRIPMWSDAWPPRRCWSIRGR